MYISIYYLKAIVIILFYAIYFFSKVSFWFQIKIYNHQKQLSFDYLLQISQHK